MNLTEDKQKITSLLEETIMLLCKNGLRYDLRLDVDAIVVITLDENDTFHVCIKGSTSKNQTEAQEKKNNIDKDSKISTVECKRNEKDMQKNVKETLKNVTETPKKIKDLQKNAKEMQKNVKETQHSIKETQKHGKETQRKDKEDTKTSSSAQSTSPQKYSFRKRSAKQISPVSEKKDVKRRKKSPEKHSVTEVNGNESSPRKSKDSNKTAEKLNPFNIHVKEEKEDKSYEVATTSADHLPGAIGSITPINSPEKNTANSTPTVNQVVSSSFTGTCVNITPSTTHTVLNLSNASNTRRKTAKTSKNSPVVVSDSDNSMERSLRNKPSTTQSFSKGLAASHEKAKPSVPVPQSLVYEAPVIDIRPTEDAAKHIQVFNDQPLPPAVTISPVKSITDRDVHNLLKKFEPPQNASAVKVYTYTNDNVKIDRVVKLSTAVQHTNHMPSEAFKTRGVGIYKCSLCETKFFKEANYNRHMEEQHKKGAS